MTGVRVVIAIPTHVPLVSPGANARDVTNSTGGDRDHLRGAGASSLSLAGSSGCFGVLPWAITLGQSPAARTKWCNREGVGGHAVLAARAGVRVWDSSARRLELAFLMRHSAITRQGNFLAGVRPARWPANGANRSAARRCGEMPSESAVPYAWRWLPPRAQRRRHKQAGDSTRVSMGHVIPGAGRGSVPKRWRVMVRRLDGQ